MGSDESRFNVSVGISDGHSHKTVSTDHNLLGFAPKYWVIFERAHPTGTRLKRGLCLKVRSQRPRELIGRSAGNCFPFCRYTRHHNVSYISIWSLSLYLVTLFVFGLSVCIWSLYLHSICIWALYLYLVTLFVFGHSVILFVFGHSVYIWSLYLVTLFVFGHSVCIWSLCLYLVTLFGHSICIWSICLYLVTVTLFVFGHSVCIWSLYLYSVTLFGHSIWSLYLYLVTLFGHSICIWSLYLLTKARLLAAQVTIPARVQISSRELEWPLLWRYVLDTNFWEMYKKAGACWWTMCVEMTCMWCGSPIPRPLRIART